ETFLLLASDKAPLNVGWFDAKARPTSCTSGDLRMRAQLRSECQLDGEGFLVDARTAAPASAVMLQHGVDDVLQCDDDDDCTYYYAVVASPRLDGPRTARVMVESGSDSGVVHDPKIRQLQ